MKAVNDFLSAEAFVIKDTEHNNEVLGLQINIFGEDELSKEYGNRVVLAHCMETSREIWGELALDDSMTLVLYI